MDHDAAVQMKAPERYAIGELAAAERDEFEEHFAGCSRCMDEVLAFSAFAANAHAVFRDRAAAPALIATAPKRGWLWNLRWQVAIPAFVAAALAAFAIYQNSVTIPRLRAPQAFMPAIVLDGTTRSSLPQVREGAPLRFQMALAPGAQAGHVWAELSGPTGRTLSAGWILPPASDTLDIYFPLRPEPGRYTVTIRDRGAGGAELARNRFEITGQEASPK